MTTTASIPAAATEGEAPTTRYGIECEMLPEESFYLVCAYDVDALGSTVARRVIGKTASFASAARQVDGLRASSERAA